MTSYRELGNLSISQLSFCDAVSLFDYDLFRFGRREECLHHHRVKVGAGFLLNDGVGLFQGHGVFILYHITISF